MARIIEFRVAVELEDGDYERADQRDIDNAVAAFRTPAVEQDLLQAVLKPLGIVHGYTFKQPADAWHVEVEETYGPEPRDEPEDV